MIYEKLTALFLASALVISAAESKETKTHGSALFSADGKVDRAEYVRLATTFDANTLEARFGPTFEELNPKAVDDRPTLFKPPSRACDISFANRINPYELGPDHCFMDDDYWSDSGQVGYLPDNPEKDPGLDRIQTFAYYNHAFALSPRLDYASGEPHPDPQTRESTYATLLGGHGPKQPIAMVRNYGMLQNEALVLYRDGLLGVAGTQTSRSGDERPYPGFVFPKDVIPTALAVTTENEFALVTVWNTTTLRGQLAVIALEAKYLKFHTWPYIALPNQGSFSDFKLLGYIDLPMATPSAVTAASNGWWGGPSQTNNLVLSQIDLKDENMRNSIYKGEPGWSGIIATKGYALVMSQLENQVVFVDLAPLINYIRESYIGSKKSYEEAIAQRGPGSKDFPRAFSENEKALPRVVKEISIDHPTAVLAGMRVGRWTQDPYKAYIASQDGTIRIYDTSSLMARYEWEQVGKLTELGKIKVGRNPVDMVFTRFGDSPLPLMPKTNDGSPMPPDTLNNTFYVVCRGDREVDAVVTWGGKGQIYRRIRDSRMGDPVAVSVATRGYIVSVADFRGKKILSFRIGAIADRQGKVYGPGADGKSDFEFAGELPFAGKPFLINSVNVN
jgi:hypothetical protein